MKRGMQNGLKTIMGTLEQICNSMQQLCLVWYSLITILVDVRLNEFIYPVLDDYEQKVLLNHHDKRVLKGKEDSAFICDTQLEAHHNIDVVTKQNHIQQPSRMIIISKGK